MNYQMTLGEFFCLIEWDSAGVPDPYADQFGYHLKWWDKFEPIEDEI